MKFNPPKIYKFDVDEDFEEYIPDNKNNNSKEIKVHNDIQVGKDDIDLFNKIPIESKEDNNNNMISS